MKRRNPHPAHSERTLACGGLSLVRERRRAEILKRALPLRSRDIDRQHRDAVALGVLDQSRRMVEAEWIAIEHRGKKRRRMMAFQICRGIGDKREAGGVRFGKSVKRERGDRK